MQNKTLELAVFTIGLGLIASALIIYTQMISPYQGSLLPIVIASVPGSILILAGLCLFFVRRKVAVQVVAWIVTVAFVADALLTLNPIKWIISAFCLYLIWRTAGQAIRQIEARGQ
jgi:hypothetical protein